MAVPFEESFDALLGVVYEHVGPEEVRASFEVRPELLDRCGGVRGGVFTAVAEGTASMGTAVGVMADSMIASGMSNSTSVVADVDRGRIGVVARCRAALPDVWTWDVEARDEQGRTCALSDVLIAVRPMRS